MIGKTAFGVLVGAALAVAAVGCGGSENCDQLEQMCPQCASPSAKTVCETVAIDSDEDTCEGYVDMFAKNGC